MRTFILLFCSTVFSFSTTNIFSQNFNVVIDKDKTVTIDEVFDLFRQQAEYTFIYHEDLFKDVPRVHLKKGKIRANELLKEILSNGNFNFNLNKNNVIVITEVDPAENTTQKFEITGIVTDISGQALPGANILEKGTTNGVQTDFDGKFTLEVADKNAVLIISYVGFISREISINGKNTFTIILIEDAAELDEVILTGYSRERKSDLTGAVAIVDMGEVVSQPVSSVENMLTGRVSGVNVISSGSPGGASSIRIRGFSTIRNNDPLYVIDGVPTTTGMNLINPNDIESLQVLKDASSASIYGSRAANGVVIITTKKGKTEKVNVSLDVYAGVQNITSFPKNLSAQDYGSVFWDAFANDGITPNHSIYGNGATPVIPAFLDAENTIPSSNTDWMREIFNQAIVQSYNLSLSKGGEKSHTMFSVNYFDQEGTLKFTGFKRITARLNSDFKILNDKVTIGENLTVANSQSVESGVNSILYNPVFNAFRIPSIAPVYDLNGNFTGYPLSDSENPLGQLYRNKDNAEKSIRIFGNVFSEISLFKDFLFKTNIGINYATYKSDIFNPTFVEPITANTLNTLTVNDRVNYDWVWSNILNYSKTLNDKHFINVLVGMESLENTSEFNTASVSGFPTNEINIRVLDAGNKGTQTNTGNKIQSSLFSYFGKINYTFDNKYLFSATIRRDGTSKLLNNRWGTFPALSAGWKISEENFFNKEGLVSNLKLRAGWGKTGNQDIPAYQTVSGFNSNPFYSNYAIDGSQNSTQTGYTLSRIANPDLKWETTTQTNIGLEIGMLNNSLSFTADYFVKNTDDLLLYKSITPDQGYTNRGQWQNVGSMENKGFEFTMDYQSKRDNDFNFNIGLNLSVIDNKLISLGQGIEFIETNPAVLHITNFDQPTSRTAVGQPIASFYGYVVDGIFQTDAEALASGQSGAQAGDFIFRDLTNDGVISDKDRTFIGSPHADFTYGINFSGQFKQFDFSMFFQGSQGNDIYDLSRFNNDFFNQANYNKSERILNAWTPTNTNTNMPRISLNDLNNNMRPSSYFVQDGSYLRMKTLQFGYNFSENILEKLNLSKLRIYIDANNLFTITKYDGLDPEIGLQNYESDDRNLDIGVDRGVYPNSTTILLGINLNF